MPDKEYKLTGLPAFILFVLPMLLGYFVIGRAVAEYLF